MTEQPAIPPIKIAFILDGEIVDILHTDERLGAIFLSNPVIIDVTGNMVENGGIASIGTGYNYETGEFFIKEENV